MGEDNGRSAGSSWTPFSARGERCDYDLHCQPPSGDRISWQNRVSCGGFLDVDMREDVDEAVENIFFEIAAPGRYQFWVRNFSGHTGIPFKVLLRVKLPVHDRLDGGKELLGTKQNQGASTTVRLRRPAPPTSSRPNRSDSDVFDESDEFAESDSDVQDDSDILVFDFDVPPPPATAATEPASVSAALSAMPHGTDFVLIDSKKISGWEPPSGSAVTWPMLDRNADDFLRAVPKSHHLEASNAAEVISKFEEVAEMMEDVDLSEQI